MVKIAVVGGGLFGITCALKLDAQGYEVHLHETQPTLMNAASRVNQRRLHMGYHYPRGCNTIQECLTGLETFIPFYGACVMPNTQTYYCIAKEGSKTSPEQYLKTLDECGLPYQIVPTPKHIKEDKIALTIKCPEQTFNWGVLKGLCLAKLEGSNVHVHLGTYFWSNLVHNFDFVVVATYLYNNFYREGCEQKRQVELVEKPVVVLDGKFKGVSTVIGDGEFCCLDYMEESGVWLMGHVKHAIHFTQVTTGIPYIGEAYEWLLNAGVIPASYLSSGLQRYCDTNFRAMRDGVEEFFNVASITHVGSMFTQRVVLPDHDGDDERPTLVEKVGDKIITVFAGKIPTVVGAANQVCNIINKEVV